MYALTGEIIILRTQVKKYWGKNDFHLVFSHEWMEKIKSHQGIYEISWQNIEKLEEINIIFICDKLPWTQLALLQFQ